MIGWETVSFSRIILLRAVTSCSPYLTCIKWKHNGEFVTVSCFISDNNDEFRLHFKLGWGGVYSKVIGRIWFRFVSNVTHVKLSPKTALSIFSKTADRKQNFYGSHLGIKDVPFMAVISKSVAGCPGWSLLCDKAAKLGALIKETPCINKIWTSLWKILRRGEHLMKHTVAYCWMLDTQSYCLNTEWLADIDGNRLIKRGIGRALGGSFIDPLWQATFIFR